MTFLQAVEAMKQGKRVRRSGWKKNNVIFNIFLQSHILMTSVGYTFESTLFDFDATDWEIYEEPKKTRTVVRYQWATRSKDLGWFSNGIFFENEKQHRESCFSSKDNEIKRLDYTRTEFEEECE
jgi:hypothetical protein